MRRTHTIMESGHVVAYLGITDHAEDDTNYLDLFVQPAARGRGYARKLVARACYAADITGENLRLIVAPQDDIVEHTRLRAFYASFGFETATDLDPDIAAQLAAEHHAEDVMVRYARSEVTA